jgi:hypothetical protein
MRIALAFNAVILLLGTLLFVAPVLREEFDWRHAVGAESAEALEAYLTVHPVGRHAAQAEEAIADRDWMENRDRATIADLEAYLSRHPHGRYAPEARARLDWAIWSEAEAAGVLGSYRDYLAQVPDGEFAPEARRRVAAIAAFDGTWRGTTSQGEPITLTVDHGAITAVELAWAHECAGAPFGLGGILRVPESIAGGARSGPGQFADGRTENGLGWIVGRAFTIATAGANYANVVQGAFASGDGAAGAASGTYEIRYTDGPGIAVGQYANATGGMTSVAAVCPAGAVGDCPIVSSEYSAAGELIRSRSLIFESRLLPALPDSCQPATTVTWTAERSPTP